MVTIVMHMDRTRLAIVALVITVLVAGCGEVVDDSPTPEMEGSDEPSEAETDAGDSGLFDDPDRQAQFDAVTADMDDETAAAFEAAVTDDDGVTEAGMELVDRLAEIEAIGVAQRDAVAVSVADRGAVDDDTIATIDRLLASPDPFRETALEFGLTDTTDSGILDGEKAALGLEPTEPDPDMVALAEPLAADGYERTDVEFLTRAGELSAFERQQASDAGLLVDAVEDGTVTDDELDAVADSSGDGLLDHTSERFGLDPDESDEAVADLAEPLAADGFDETEVDYLVRVAELRDDEFRWAQAEATGLLDETVADGTVTDDAVDGLSDDAGDGLLNGKARQLGLEASESNEEIAALAEPLAADGYDDTEIAYLERVVVVTDDEFKRNQAEAFGLLSEAVADGELSEEEAEGIESFDAGLLHAKASAIGVTERPEAAPTIAELSEPLAAEGYGDNEFDYLERVVEIHQYEGHDYEVWTQAEQLGLLHGAVADGEISDDELWEIENDASNRLLNGMETEFGTDPNLADTSGDGYEDHLKWGPLRDMGLEVNPGEVDVYIEIESERGASKPTASQQQEIIDLFAEEPSDDIGPINVHFHEFRTDVDPVEDRDDMAERAADRNVEGFGLHYLLITDEPYYFNGEEAGGEAWASTRGPSWMVALDAGSRAYRTGIVAHEMGHALGIFGGDFAGVDSTEYSADEYNSIMNYNVQGGGDSNELTFSIGEPFNDYEHMQDQEFGSFHTDTSGLERAWEAGEVPEDLLEN